eukprot:6194614-Pleurochrysis_carterae.AAC.1
MSKREYKPDTHDVTNVSDFLKSQIPKTPRYLAVHDRIFRRLSLPLILRGVLGTVAQLFQPVHTVRSCKQFGEVASSLETARASLAAYKKIDIRLVDYAMENSRAPSRFLGRDA